MPIKSLSIDVLVDEFSFGWRNFVSQRVAPPGPCWQVTEHFGRWLQGLSTGIQCFRNTAIEPQNVHQQ